MPGVEEHVGRAEHPRPLAAERRPAPLPGRRERHDRLGLPSRVAPDRRDRPQARVRAFVGGRERADGVEHLVVGRRAVRSFEAGDLEGALGERAGLVDADDVDPGEHLHRGQLLHQGPPARQARRPDREGDAREQHQALGDHGADAGHRGPQRFAEIVGAAHLRDDEEHPGGQQEPAPDAQDRVRAGSQLGVHGRELLRLLRQLRRVGGIADGGRLEPAAPGDDEAAGQDVVAGLLVQRLALAGEEGLVDFEPRRRAHDAVDRDLVAGRDLDDVAVHDGLARHLADRAVAHDANPWRG